MSVIKTTRNSSKTSHLIAHLITCIVLLLPISAFPFPTWVYVDPAMPEGSPPQIEITDHCDNYTKVKVKIPGFWCEDVYEAGHTFQRIWIPLLYGTKMEDGKPELPVVRGLLGIPGANNATDVEVLSATWEQFSDYLVYPHQPDHLISEPPPPFEWDEEFYQQNLWYPGDEALLSDPGMLREVKVVNNHIQCFQYNPAREFLKVASEMEIKVSYGASGGGSGDLQLEGETINRVHEDFMPLYQSLVWNCNELNLFPSKFSMDYLIITGNNYYESLVPLQSHLEQRDFDVIIVTMNQITGGEDPLYLYHYIRWWYDNAGIAYVLLVGDVADNYGQEPFNKNTMVPIPYWIPNSGYPYVSPSDVCYACLGNENPPSSPPVSYEDIRWENWWNTSDWYPDIYVGRLTADEIYHVEDQVDKIIYYENGDDPDPDPEHLWYDNILFVAHQEDFDHPSSFENDKKEIINPEEHQDIPYEIELPPVEFLKGSEAGTTNEDVIDFIELGCNIVNYYGHGSWPQWNDWARTPDTMDYTDFTKDPHVRNLSNDHLPVVFNIACSTAEIDHDHLDSHGGDTLCDFWLRLHEGGGQNPYQGAVAAIGATRGAKTTHCEYFDKALFRMMYGPLAVPQTPENLVEPMNILGAVHYGALARAFFHLRDIPTYDPKWVLTGFYNFILLGEPSMRIRNIYTETSTLILEKKNFLTDEMPLEVAIYPNPSTGIFTLKVQGNISGLGDVKVYDISGRLIRKIEFPQLDTVMGGLETGLPEMELSLDLNDLSEGLYILGIGNEVMERVVICK